MECYHFELQGIKGCIVEYFGLIYFIEVAVGLAVLIINEIERI